MTSPSSDPVAAPAVKPASRWEDFMDIFYAPMSVYERRQNDSPWPTIFIVAILLVIVTLLTFNAISPVIESEIRAPMLKMMAKNPQMTQDMLETQVKIQMFVRHWIGVFFPIGVLIGAVFVWIVARVVGAKETYKGALIVIAYASIIAVLQAIVVGAQGLVLDVSSMTTLDQLSLSAARFADKATMSPALYAVLKQLDVFGIWGLIVTAIGVRVTAKTTKEKAIAFGIAWFVFGTLLAVGGAFWQARASGG
jgi:hypothetical protein